MELSLTLLTIGYLKIVTSQELLDENAQNQQNLAVISSLPENDPNAVTGASSVNTNSAISSETLKDIFDVAKNISYSKGIYRTNDEDGMAFNEPEIRRSIQKKVAVSTLSDVLEKVLNEIDTDVNKLALLDYLEPLVHEFDVAVNFANLGGIQKISPLLLSNNDDIASSALMILGAAMQSNPIVQNIALKENLVQDLLKLFSHKSALVLSRVIFALASLLRNSPIAQEIFFEENGVLQLSKILKNHLIATNIKLKVINLLNDLVVEKISAEIYSLDPSSQPSQKLKRLLAKGIQDYGICKFIPSFLDLEDFDSHEKIVTAMLSLHNMCTEYFQNEDVFERIKYLLTIYNPESNDAVPFYPAIDMELKMMLHSKLKSLSEKIVISNIKEYHKELEYTKSEL